MKLKSWIIPQLSPAKSAAGPPDALTCPPLTRRAWRNSRHGKNKICLRNSPGGFTGLVKFALGITFITGFLGGPESAKGQIAVRHTVAPSSPSSVINHTLNNTRAEQILIVSHDFGNSGPYVTAPVYVSYDYGFDRWRIHAGGTSSLPLNAQFNILAAAPGDNAFAHVASAANTIANYTTMDSPVLNGKPNARVLVTEARPGTANLHPVGVFYSGNRWHIFNQNLAAMPAEARFFVYVDDRAFVAEAPAAPLGNNFAADHVSTNGKSGAIVFATPYWTGIYNPHLTGVYYASAKWRIYNEDLAAMPASAKFNLLALSEGNNTIYPPVRPRSSQYDASSTGVEYPYENRLNPQTAITLEAWVYPDGRSACGTIISNEFNGSAGSYWLGLCPQLRFFRSGGTSADAATPVPAFKWTHVAVTYDGATARFFVNGEAAGTRALPNAGTGGNHPVMIGRDPAGYYFGGNLDEIRLWRGTRTQAQIRQGMWEEPRDDLNLAAVFDTGGAYEVIGDLTGTAQPLHPKVSGIGILPRALLVPRSRQPSAFVNGSIDPFLEYTGAEHFVLRYPSSAQPDRVGYLIHNGLTLFGGVVDLNTPLPAITPDQSFGAAYFDSDGSGGDVAASDDLRISHTLGTIKRLDEGNSSGGWQAPRDNLGWQAAMGPRLDEFAAGSMEFALGLSRLGPTAAEALTQTDRFAFFHNGYDTVGDHYGAPGNALHNSPATWAPMTYTNEISGPALAYGVYSGRVVDANTGASLANRRVRLFSPGGLEYGATTTDASGEYRFQRAVPPIPLTVQVPLNEGERAAAPLILRNNPGPAPEFTAPTDARYPACEVSPCEFDAVQFSIRTALGAVTMAALPASVTAPLTVRGGAEPKVHPAGEAVLTGTNFHPDLEVFFTTQVTTPLTTPLAGLTEGTHYWRATVRNRTATTLTVACPDVPLNRRPGSFQIVLRDTWSRPANSPPTSPWKLAPGAMLVENPPYPLVHGFEFANLADGHDFDDYRAVFAGDVCNPLTMVAFWAYFPIYVDSLGGGECYGMTLTAQQFFKGRATAPFAADAAFANGFRLQQPATFNTDNFCAPAPTNILGQIRVNHGSQMSAGYFAERVTPSVSTMTEAIARLTSRPLDYHLCFRFLGMGHCVQPLRVKEVLVDGVRQDNLRQIEIYDCNHPGQIKIFNVDLGTNQYDYDGFDTRWSGPNMNIYETEVLQGRGNQIPSLGSLSAAFLQLVVSGNAEPMVTSADGGQMGWNAAGNFVQTSTDTYDLPVANWIDSSAPALGHYPVTMFHRLSGAAPKVDIHARGAGYTVHASNQGTMFQLFVSEAVDGQDDGLGFLRNGNGVDGLSFAPSGGGRKVKALIALCQGGATFPAAISLANLKVPAGKSIVMRALPGSTGIEFLNDTGLPQTPHIEVALPQAGAPAPRLVAPSAIIELPPGSSLQMRSADGTDYENLLTELDLDGNGTPERRWIFHTGTLILEELPIIPPVTEVPTLTLTRTDSTAQLRWQQIPGWVLTSSKDLSRWEVVSGIVLEGSAATHTISLPSAGYPTLYFRLEKR